MSGLDVHSMLKGARRFALGLGKLTKLAATHARVANDGELVLGALVYARGVAQMLGMSKDDLRKLFGAVMELDEKNASPSGLVL